MTEKIEISAEELAILEELKPLFIEARKNKLWFYCKYLNIWFSPDEAEKKHKEGKFIFSAVNWELRDPMKELNNLKVNINKAKQAYKQFINRLIYEKYSFIIKDF